WSLFVFFPLYATFAYSFNESVINTNILYIYLLTVLNRMRFAFSNVSPEVRMTQMGKSALRAIFYFFLILGVCIANNIIPPFGLTQEYLEKSGYFQTVKSSGLFIEKPFVPICMGFIYYALPVLYFVYRTIKKFGPTSKGKLVYSQTTFKSNKM
ncbi:MAG TPA: hypothetical protein VFQ56_07530, partial [Flavobacterium sp.]|nr:hypothetical protein [Flavobacterium sp.]